MPEGSLPTHDTLRAAELAERYADLDAADLIAVARDAFPGRLALVSSFGTESAVLLALAAEVDRRIPVIFVNTGKLFGETLRYRDTLVSRLGLQDVRSVGPRRDEVDAADRDGLLWQKAPDLCCHLRKTLPLNRALEGFDAWITGRKRFQSSTRAALPVFEAQDGRIKVNPLAHWDKDRLEAEFARRDLPRHPLEADGFLSIGCYTCTERVAPGADPRSGRWAGTGKSECGIHTNGAGDFTDAWSI
ncbi:phosphoadenylyl-sulfate reductase [Azospirillum halopraeferens]|uniref:phosphoadenylyl-sulfate reductase n=1 Tax=Azospirillum halopraeferens TaxID=34010 RepID=UPI00040639B1|nr:phosphoadenylyl-sulfate reductase [Azospirillum halopraeferens]